MFLVELIVLISFLSSPIASPRVVSIVSDLALSYIPPFN